MCIIRLFIVFALASVLSCDDGCTPHTNCLDKMLAEYGMFPYEGEELGCRFFLSMFTFQGKTYFRVENHCADVISFYVDCNGNKVCEDPGPQCLTFEAEAAYMGIVGID